MIRASQILSYLDRSPIICAAITTALSLAVVWSVFLAIDWLLA